MSRLLMLLVWGLFVTSLHADIVQEHAKGFHWYSVEEQSKPIKK